VYRFIKGGTENYKNIAPTVGVEFSSKMVTLTGDKRIKVQIWDTGNNEFIQLDRNSIEP
jgi:GTPase SAR1 family protein